MAWETSIRISKSPRRPSATRLTSPTRSGHEIAPLMPKPGRRGVHRGGRGQRSDQRGALSCALRLRLSDAADPFRPVADSLRLVPGIGAAVPVSDHPRPGADGRSRAGRARGQPLGGGDRQPSVEAPQAATRGYDAGKKIVGRKRHIAVDTDGRLLMVNLTSADISDSAGAQAILDAVRKRWPW